MCLESAYIPEKKSLTQFFIEKGRPLQLGSLGFGPRAAENISSKFSSAVLNLISANAHNDWLRQKIIISLHGGDADSAYEIITSQGTKTGIEKEKRYKKLINELSSGELNCCLKRVYDDAKKVSDLRHILAHGIYGYAEKLDDGFLVFEPAGLTKAHARSLTLEHKTTDLLTMDPHLFATNHQEIVREGFDASLPNLNNITVWNAELLNSALEACHCVGRSLDIIIQTMRPHSHPQFTAAEVYQILARYGTTSIDLSLYFAMRFAYKEDMSCQREKS